MTNDKVVFVLSKMIQHFIAKDSRSQSNYVAYLEHIIPELSPELLAVVDPIYKRTTITDLATVGKTGWMYRNWTLKAIGEDVAKIIDAMSLDSSRFQHYLQVSHFAAQHNIAFNL